MTPLEKQLYDMEGEVLHAYQDHLGYWTIGVGHLIDKRKGGGIPVSISRQLLAMDIKEKTRELSEKLPWTASLDEARFSALVNMAFQMGVEGVLKFPKMLLHLRNGNWQGACDAALDSIWAREQTPKRAQRIARQLLTGLWS
jgi:lysozyme